MLRELKGWLLSVYPDEEDGAVVWLLGDDDERHRLTQTFRVMFYIAGEDDRLKAIQDELQSRPTPPKTSFQYRRDLYKGLLPVLGVQVDNPVAQQKLFFWMKKTFKWVRYFDARTPFPIRYGVAKKVFPMAECRLQVNEQNQIIEIEALDSPWDIVYALPPLRILTIEPDLLPQRAQPNFLSVQYEDTCVNLGLSDELEAVLQLQHILEQYDPDVIFARWGDGWLFPHLIDIAERHQLDFNPSRDTRLKYHHIQERTFESYGSIYFRAQQTHLFGRWHIDPKNSSMDMGFKFSMRSSVELARVTCLDVQTAARNSPGSGFTAMQIREAARRGILVPLHKRQTERFKSALGLNAADGGGLNYRPIVGIHDNVAEIDFFSMYPSIMMTWNISGETVGAKGTQNRYTPDSGVPINQDVDGLVASVLKPLLDKRLQVKRIMRNLDQDDPQRRILESMADALKWLGYVSFGYQGYKNNLFGNIQAHEAICAIGRETLVSAIETAHEFGFKVLAANVDSLFVQKAGAKAPQDFMPLMDEIMHRTGLVIELEGIFDWLIFTASKLNPRIGAANRYVGKFDHGGLKVRGLAQRRSDTCQWIADAEREIFALMAQENEANRLPDLIPEVIALTQGFISNLEAEQVPIKDLVCQTRLSREPDQYKGNSTSAKAARQLAAEGKHVRVGQRVQFLYTHGDKTSIFAWDLPLEPDYSLVNKQRYKELLLRMVDQITQSLGLTEDDLLGLVSVNRRQLALFEQQ